ncbi:hypothetical protein J4460_07855 [Candidatus Woesearchaeota archaeon]|nr:hypothetical protein [Candidatus Woesearchaeota archaeon]HIH37710.1 hypothetical protein [Candidatus Woesearchaeota archaeon]HIH48253.1 hypothetical protein [Candidatus Woesearchaeota archaeon]HIJ03263.1 hypothetical protein [Candidatus Woesearchaeota archaeon]
MAQDWKKFLDDNQKERMAFIDKWAEYALTHDDKDWSAQQNLIINSALRSCSLTKEQFLEMKKIRRLSLSS